MLEIVRWSYGDHLLLSNWLDDNEALFPCREKFGGRNFLLTFFGCGVVVVHHAVTDAIDYHKMGNWVCWFELVVDRCYDRTIF